MDALFWITYTVVLAPSLLALGWLFFRDWSSFLEALYYDLIPDLISLIRGRLAADWWAEFKLYMFMMIGLVIATLEHGLVESFFEWMNRQ